MFILLCINLAMSWGDECGPFTLSMPLIMSIMPEPNLAKNACSTPAVTPAAAAALALALAFALALALALALLALALALESQARRSVTAAAATSMRVSARNRREDWSTAAVAVAALTAKRISRAENFIAAPG
jgi:hypothetical protein